MTTFVHATTRPPDPTPFWQHESFTAGAHGLALDGVALKDLARQHGTPLYVYSRATLRRGLHALGAALAAATDRYRIYYAMKANRCPGVLEAVRSVDGTGIDACSPREVDLALEVGFSPGDISFNAGMLSNRDLEHLAARGVHCTLDSFSALRRYGALVPPGTAVGIRIDPGVDAGYGSGQKSTYGRGKFGFEPEECARALSTARESGLVVDSAHVHIGWGLPEGKASAVASAFSRLASVARQLPDLRMVNVGGGLGGRFRAVDTPLSLATWSQLLVEHLAPLGATIACEPGTFIAAPAGVLLVEVNTVEERRGVLWIGVDAGHPVNPCPMHFGIPMEVMLVRDPFAPMARVGTVAGHINEAYDLWAVERPLPTVREGDLLALLPAGAYGASMASDHCLRGRLSEVVV